MALIEEQDGSETLARNPGSRMQLVQPAGAEMVQLFPDEQPPSSPSALSRSRRDERPDRGFGVNPAKLLFDKISKLKPLEAFGRRVVKRGLSGIGMELKRVRPDWETFPTTGLAAQLVRAKLIEQVANIELMSGRISVAAAATYVDEFMEFIRFAPIRQRSGGGGFAAGLALFSVIKLVQPLLFIESGVFRGYTTWVASRAMPPENIIGFDTDLGPLKFRPSGTRFIEGDLNDFDFVDSDRRRTLVFFDDHVNQGQRINDAYRIGFKHLIFDDNFPIESIHADGCPPVPTIDMIFDDRIVHGQRMEWRTDLKNVVYVHDRPSIIATRELIKSVKKLPPIGSGVGYTHANFTYVELR